MSSGAQRDEPRVRLDLSYPTCFHFLPSHLIYPFPPPLLFRIGRLLRALLTTSMIMSDYAVLDPYCKSHYEQGIDAKVVVMGNTGPHTFLSSPSPMTYVALLRRRENKSPSAIHTE